MQPDLEMWQHVSDESLNLHLEQYLYFGLLLGHATGDKGPQHVLANLSVRSKPLGGRCFGNPIKSMISP
jgi:hypothetical protein